MYKTPSFSVWSIVNSCKRVENKEFQGNSGESEIEYNILGNFNSFVLLYIISFVMFRVNGI